jgi:hypothetical protein
MSRIEYLLSHPILIEVSNAFLLCLALCALFIFVRFMLYEMWQGEWRIKGALSMIAILTGCAIIAFFRWLLWALRNNGGDMKDFHWFVIGTSIGTVILSWGIVCAIKVFAPAHWFRTLSLPYCARQWLPSVIAAAISAIGAYLLYRWS